jgi:hypothetical protein
MELARQINQGGQHILGFGAELVHRRSRSIDPESVETETLRAAGIPAVGRYESDAAPLDT